MSIYIFYATKFSAFIMHISTEWIILFFFFFAMKIEFFLYTLFLKSIYFKLIILSSIFFVLQMMSDVTDVLYIWSNRLCMMIIFASMNKVMKRSCSLYLDESTDNIVSFEPGGSWPSLTKPHQLSFFVKPYKFYPSLSIDPQN